jgi:hypothetical protein
VTTVRFATGRVRLLKGEPKLFANDRTQGVVSDLERRMALVSGIAKLKVRVRTGLLLTTIRQRTNINLNAWPSVDVLAGRAGARTVPVIEDQGSAPHVIRARRKKALRFMINGQVVFRQKVNHPGTQGSGFLTDSLKYAAS